MESLLAKFKEYLPDYRVSSLNNLLLLTLCILDGGTVNLYKLRGRVAKFIAKPIAADSGYKRLIRVFDKHAHSRLWLSLLQCVFRLLRLQSKYLILDGTSWKHQGVKHHYLTLSIIYRSVAIPIYWVDLSKLGISSFKERKQMFKRLFKHFNLKGKILLADREYIGKEWFNFLINNGLLFIIRLRKKNYQSYVNQTPGKSYQQLIDKVLRSKLADKAVGKPIEIDGVSYTFVVTKYLDTKGKAHLLLLLGSLNHHPKAIADAYLKRWKIECCFRHLKSNGFDLEQLNLKGKARGKLLMAVMVFAYVISIHEGLKTYKNVREIQRSNGPLEKAESVFRHGYDNLIAKVDSLVKLVQYIITEIQNAINKYQSANWLVV